MIKKISFLILVSFGIISYSQVSSRSPYSFFGIGDQSQQITTATAGMGGISVAANQMYELNFSNPALLSEVSFTLFDLGANTQFIKLDDGTDSQSTSNSTLSYLSMGFPITKKMGFMFGLQPNTNVGYNVVQEIFNSDDEVIEANVFRGNGGSNRVFMGTGYKIYKDLSVGVEGELLFGKIENSVINQRDETQLYTKYSSQANISGTALKLGVSYKKDLKKGLQLRLESSAKLQNSINSKGDDYLYTFYYSSSGAEVPQDTMYANKNIEGKITRPLLFHSGIGFGKPEKWFAGLEYNFQNAWNSDSPLMDNSKFAYSNYSSFRLGGYYLPKKNSITSYWDRVIYRIGLKYETPGMSLKNDSSSNSYTDLKDFGISFGLGLPMGNQLTRLNMSVEYGKRGETNNGLIQENYVNLRFGLNLAEKWFQKNKIN